MKMLSDKFFWRTKRSHGPNPLASVQGYELGSVEFVRDYIQLRFDGATLTALNLPNVVRGSDVVYLPTMSGYRDALCAQIGQAVISATAEAATQIRIDFTNGVTFVISLREEDYRFPGAEAAIFDDAPHGQYWVW